MIFRIGVTRGAVALRIRLRSDAGGYLRQIGPYSCRRERFHNHAPDWGILVLWCRNAMSIRRVIRCAGPLRVRSWALRGAAEQ